MANYKKFTRQQLGKMLSHYDRTDENPKENIDRSRTYLNYNLAPKADEKQMDIMNQRLAEVKVQNRKDVNLLCTWVITLPKTLPEDKEEEFFRQSYKFLEDRYGKENVVSAFIHKDEVTPHMHFAFIPVVKDAKKDRLKVSAKECVTLLDLKQFHPELQEHLERELGCQVDILNEATLDGNKAIAELKRESAVELLEKATTEATEIVSRASFKARLIEDTSKSLEIECEAIGKMLEAFNAEPNMDGIKANYPTLSFGKKEVISYTVEPKRMNELLTKEKVIPKIEEAHAKLDKDLAELKETLTYKEYRKAVKDYHRMKDELATEQKKTQQLQQQLDKYKDRYGEIEEPVKVRQQNRTQSRNRSNDNDGRGM